MPKGLPGEEAARRLARQGPNELPAARQRTLWRILLEVVREPMFLLLLAAGALYLFLGERSDALMLLGFVVITMSITIFQERKTERVLESLRDLSSPRALVIRDGEPIRIPGREVVRGDLLVLEEGDRVAADGILAEAHDLLVDESLLTGESAAISKTRTGPEGERVFSGTMVVRGGGLAEVTATGGETEIGKIGRRLQELEPQRSALQQEIRMLVKRFSIAGVAISLLVFVLYGLMRGNWINGLLAGITLAMSVLPEEFMVVLTVFMALGAWRIARHQVLTRHTPVIEALGSATVLCVDKTGTLTQNRMSVKAVATDHPPQAVKVGAGPLPPSVHRVLCCASLASEIMPFDPMERAFHRALDEALPGQRGIHAGWTLVHDYPLTREIMAMTHAWGRPGDPECIVAAKGAPEAVAKLCRLDARRTAQVLEQARRIAGQGMRVLATARARYPLPQSEGGWPESPAVFDFEWLGLAGLADPLRPAVPAAIAECREAGIRVVMITGDYPDTARAIAGEAGLRNDRIVTGTQLDAMNDAQLAQAVRDTHVFARIQPEQKLRLVNAFKAGGEIVAMTGDGVNDAPALKAAHIGIGMGERGTDVAREASSLVLLKDDFNAIVQAVKLGRRIYDNLRKALTYVIAAHLPIAGMALLPLLLGTPLAFAPVHIVFLEMIMNPACAIAFESEEAEADAMRRPPRGIGERLLGRRSLGLALLQGAGLLAAVAAVFFIALDKGMGDSEARAMAFASLVAGNLALITVGRSSQFRPWRLLRTMNAAQRRLVAGSIAALLLVLGVPALQRAFHFGRLHVHDLAVPLLVWLLSVAWFEAMKAVFARRAARPGLRRIG